MATIAGVELRDLPRSALVVAGVMLLGVGLGNCWVGRVKSAQYRAMLVRQPPPRVRTLFHTPREGEERQTVALAKIGFYQMLFNAGRLLAAAGLCTAVAGFVRLRRHPLPPPRSTA